MSLAATLNTLIGDIAGWCSIECLNARAFHTRFSVFRAPPFLAPRFLPKKALCFRIASALSASMPPFGCCAASPRSLNPRCASWTATRRGRNPPPSCLFLVRTALPSLQTRISFMKAADQLRQLAPQNDVACTSGVPPGGATGPGSPVLLWRVSQGRSCATLPQAPIGLGHAGFLAWKDNTQGNRAR